VNEADVLAAIRQHWIDEWVGPAHVQPYIWDDDPDRPSDPEWLRVTLRSAGNAAMTVGRTREEFRGVIMTQCFTKREFGPGQCERIASAVAATWRQFRHPRIRLGVPSPTGLPVDGAFIRQLVTVDWRGDLRFS
jgi:hypothetical protein